MLTRLKLVCAALFWGGTFVAGHVVGTVLPPSVSALARFLIATLLLIVAARVMEGGLPRPDRRLAAVTFVLGAIGIFGYNSLFFTAVKLLPASRTAIIVALNPVCTAVLNALLTRQRLSVVSWAGIALSFIGALIVISHGDPQALLAGQFGGGEWIMLSGVACWALYTVLWQRILHGITPLAATTWVSIWGTLLLALYALPQLARVQWSGLSISVWANLLYLGIPGTAIAYVWYFDGVRALGAPRTAVFNNFVPVFGVALSALLLQERPPLSTLVGGLTVLAGVVLTGYGRSHEGSRGRGSGHGGGRGAQPRHRSSENGSLLGDHLLQTVEVRNERRFIHHSDLANHRRALREAARGIGAHHLGVHAHQLRKALGHEAEEP